MTRRQSEERKAAVLRFFSEHPDATGDEAQAALTSGRLTGKAGPPIGLGVLYELKRRAGETHPVPPRTAVEPPRAGAQDRGRLRELARALQEELRLHPDVSEVLVTPTGARVTRLGSEAL